MIWRILHVCVIAAFVFAAIDVYKIKYDSTLQAERVDKLRAEIRREQESIANLRAEWAKLDRPERIQGLAKRHLTLRTTEIKQFDALANLPEKPIDIVPPNSTDPIAAIIESFADAEAITGSAQQSPSSRSEPEE
jgi:cell division protein FtsL